MKSVFRLSINNSVLVHMITIAVIVLGSYMLINMPRELERDMSFNWAFIWVTYPGVSPEEIEKLITKPIEDEIADVNKIESITSTAAEGFTGVSSIRISVSNSIRISHVTSLTNCIKTSAQS